MSELSGSNEDLDNDNPRSSILDDEFTTEEDLLSLSNSPDSNSSEELPSLSNSETNEENVFQPSPSSGGGRDLSVSDHTSDNILSQDSSPDTEELVQEQPSTSRGTTIRSFKTRIDENGETIFEFASDDDEPVSEQENEEGGLGHQPPSNQPSWEGQLETIRRVQGTHYQAAIINSNQHGVGTNSDWGSEDSEDDPDYSPASTDASATSIAQRAAARRNLASVAGHILGPQQSQRVLTHLGTVRQVQLGGTARTRTTTATRRPRKKKRARKKKISVKKPAVQRVPKPVKPLLPKTIFHDENGNETAKLYRSQISSSINHRTNIKFTTEGSNENGNQISSYCKVGEVFLQMTNPDDELRILNCEMLLSNFPGLKQVILHSADYRDVALMELKTEQTLSEEEAVRQPKPKLNKSDKRRTLIFVARKMYLFPCHIEGFGTKLFTSKG